MKIPSVTKRAELTKLSKSAFTKGSALSQLGAYTLTNFLTKFISFAALPLFVNFLTEADIGILSIFSNSIVFLTPILSMGILYTISSDYFKYDRNVFAKRFSSVVLLPFALSLICAGVIFLLFDILQSKFNYHPAFIWMIPCCTVLNIYFEAYLILCRNENNVKLFTLTCIIRSVMEITIAILLIMAVEKSWISRANGMLFSGVIIFIFFITYLRRKKFYVPVIQLKPIKEEFAFAAPAILFQTAIFFMGTADKFFAMNFFDAGTTGIYSIASVFASVLFLFCLAFLQYINPKLFKAYAEGKTWRDVKKLCMIYIYSMIGLALVLAIATPIVYKLFLKPSYYSGLGYFYILLFANLIWTITNLFLSLMLFQKNKQRMLLFALTAIPLSLISCYLGISNWGLLGIAMAVVTVNLFMAALVLHQNHLMRFFR